MDDLTPAADDATAETQDANAAFEQAAPDANAPEQTPTPADTTPAPAAKWVIDPPASAPASAAAQPNKTTITLSDGRVAVVRRGKGRDLLEASRRSGKDVSRTSFELLGILAIVDGHPVGFDELMNMDLEDVSALMTANGGDPDFLRSSPATSSTSPA